MNGFKTVGKFIRHWLFGHRAPQLFLNGLRTEIRGTLKKSPLPIIKEEARKIQIYDNKLAEDAPSRGNPELTSNRLSAYRVLLPEAGINKATMQFF